MDKGGNENDLDLKRLEKESNMKFYEINKNLQFYDYMIGSSDIAAKTFIPPMFDKLEFEKISNLKRNEMNNKLLFFKSMRESYQRELEKIKDLLPENMLEEEKLDPELLKSRKFYLKKSRRSNSVRMSHKFMLTRENGFSKEIDYETLEEKIYRKTTHLNYNIKSLEDGLKEINLENLEDEYKKAFSMKQFADVIESLTAAVFTKTGLHGAQMFLKSLGLVDNKSNYK